MTILSLVCIRWKLQNIRLPLCCIYASCAVFLLKESVTDIQLHRFLYTAVSNQETWQFFVCLELHSLKLSLLKINICETKP